MVTFFWWEMGSRIPEEHRAAICSFSNSCKQTDVSSVLEESSWRFHTKIWKIHCPIKESKTWSFNHTAQCPRQIPHWNQVCSRRVSELPDISWKLTKNCFREATRSGIQRYIIFPEYICVCIYCWESRPKQESPNFEHTVRWIHTVDGGSCPHLVIYVFNASTLVVFVKWGNHLSHTWNKTVIDGPLL